MALGNAAKGSTNTRKGKESVSAGVSKQRHAKVPHPAAGAEPAPLPPLNVWSAIMRVPRPAGVELDPLPSEISVRGFLRHMRPVFLRPAPAATRGAGA